MTNKAPLLAVVLLSLGAVPARAELVFVTRS